LEIDQV